MILLKFETDYETIQHIIIQKDQTVVETKETLSFMKQLL